MNLSLSGKRAIVCGSTQGIGKATAIELAELGAGITLVARNEEALKQVLKELPANAPHSYFVADFNQPEVLKEKVTKYISENGAVHILVNNTGGPAPGPAIEAKPEEFIKTFSAHLVCNQILVQAVVEGMKQSAYGRIVNIISTSVKEPIKNLGVSNTIRAAVASWAKTLAGELGPYGITVNNVLPGYTNTQRLRSLVTGRAQSSGLSEQEIEVSLLKDIPAGRFAEASETAAAIAFLASPVAGYINGINLPVDGGRLGCL